MPLPPRRLALASFVLLGTIAAAPGAPPAYAGQAAQPLQPARGDERARPGSERELSVDEQARHVLNRLAFGARPGETARVEAMGVDRWIAEQLQPERIDDRAMDAVLARYATLSLDAGELLRAFPRPAAIAAQARIRADSSAERVDSTALRQAGRQNRQFVAELMSARVARAVGSERQLQEVMTDFWLNHFSVFVGKGQLRYFLPEYERETIRPHTLGTFRDLLGAVAKSPAMLHYLDNALSVSDSTRPTLATRGEANRQRRVQGAIQRRAASMSEADRARLEALQARRPKGLNENYARELLELHTLGVDGGYTQHDIVEVARALTGWTVRPPRAGAPEFLFNRGAHDAGEKLVLGTRLKAGRGIEDGESVLDLLARHPSTAQFIARKLVVRFVSDAPPPALVERAAAAFRRSDGDLREVVRTIVTSPEFFARDAYGTKVKSPFEVVVSAARALGAQPDTTAVSALLVARLGQPIYGHQAPDGWPETGDAWMNTGAILQRINFGLSVAANRMPGAHPRAWSAYAGRRAAPRDSQVAAVIDAFLGGRASAETREILSSGENPFLERQVDSAAAMSDEELLQRMAAGAGANGVGGAGGAGAPPDENNRRTPPRPLYQSTADRRAALRNGVLSSPTTLTGLDQVIGLALGSPEFQRR
ncbi:MAG: DUF1800 domain-containing protein [Gemmatimonadaceae bacterium]|nr:DUF1800 domain-containing protein [Gemmatimonadaceae bacterium]